MVGECAHETNACAAVDEPEAATDECVAHATGRDLVDITATRARATEDADPLHGNMVPYGRMTPASGNAAFGARRRADKLSLWN